MCQVTLREGKKVSLHWIFLGVGLPCAAFKRLNMPGNSIHHIQSAHKQCKEKADTMTQPKGCLTDVFRSAVDREQCGLTTSFTEKIPKKAHWNDICGYGPSCCTYDACKMELFLLESCNQTVSKNSSRIFSEDFFMLLNKPVAIASAFNQSYFLDHIQNHECHSFVQCLIRPPSLLLCFPKIHYFIYLAANVTKLRLFVNRKWFSACVDRKWRFFKPGRLVYILVIQYAFQ